MEVKGALALRRETGDLGFSRVSLLGSSCIFLPLGSDCSHPHVFIPLSCQLRATSAPPPFYLGSPIFSWRWRRALTVLVPDMPADRSGHRARLHSVGAFGSFVPFSNSQKCSFLTSSEYFRDAMTVLLD
jgi:hypothetical protein